MTTRPRPLALAGALALASACAVAPVELPTPDARLASLGNLGNRSAFELRTLYAAQAPAAGTDQPAARRRPVTPILFYTGVVLATLTGATAIATGSASFGLRRKLDNAYFDQGLTYDEYDRLADRGAGLARATWGLAFLTAGFAAMALISYSVDWSRCGPLAPKRRRDTAPRGRCDEFHPTPASTDATPQPAGPGLSPRPAATPAGPQPEGPTAGPQPAATPPAATPTPSG
jgi:hypothetical protein